jgi:hypothetical protein
VGVAEQRRLPPAERVVGHRDRDRDVDADHSDVDFELELARDTAVACEDRGAVAIGVLVDQVHGVAVGVDAHDRKQGPENLVVVAVCPGFDVVEQRGA